MNGINFISSSYITFGYSPVTGYCALVCSHLFESVPFRFSLVNTILSCPILFYLVPICPDLVCSILVDSVPTCPGLVQCVLSASSFYSVPCSSSLFCFFFLPLSTAFYPYHTTLPGSILLHSVPVHSICSILRDLFSSCPSAFLKSLEYLLCALSFGKDLWDCRRRKCHPGSDVSPLEGE